MAELPQNWIECELGKVIILKNGFAFKSVDYSDLGIDLIRISDIQNNTIDLNSTVKIPVEKVEESFYIEQGDLLIAMSGATTGKMGVYNHSKKSLQNQRVGNFKIIDKNKLYDKYRNYYLRHIRKDIEVAAYGGAQPNISGEKIEKFQIKLPPLNEQKRIVEKLDKMIRIVDDVNARLNKIPTALKRARQSILNQAITGELTKDWRKKNAYSSAKELISKLEIEKNNIYAKECEIAKSNETKKPQKPKYFRIANNVLDINIPNQWSFINLSQTIYDFKYGTSTKSDYSYKGIPVIRIPNISNMKLSFDDLKYLNLSDIDSSNKIKKDDILIVRSNGSRDLVGKNALVKELDKEYAFASYLIRMRPLINNPEYLILLLNTDAIKEQFFSKAKSSAGINNINTEELATTIIPLPPLEEQAEIVRRVKLTFEKLDKIELRYQKAKEYSDKLTQSILNKAFRGELVPQDPNDSPIKIPE